MTTKLYAGMPPVKEVFRKRVFVCANRFEDKMSAIYEAWAWAAECNRKTLSEGGSHDAHDDVRFAVAPLYQEDFFSDYIHVKGDSSKAEKVVRSIQRDISKEAYVAIYYAAVSEDEAALDDIYRFLRIGFRMGAKTMLMLADPAVSKLAAYRKRIGNEIHHFREFVRFSKMIIKKGEEHNEIYVSHIEPKSNIAYLVGGHFADRMPSEYWMIIDDIRRIAIIHPSVDADDSIEEGEDIGFYNNIYQRYLTEEEFEAMKRIEDEYDEYIDLWKTFFDAIGIKERENYKCQRNLFPKWMRKHVTEFN